MEYNEGIMYEVFEGSDNLKLEKGKKFKKEKNTNN